MLNEWTECGHPKNKVYSPVYTHIQPPNTHSCLLGTGQPLSLLKGLNIQGLCSAFGKLTVSLESKCIFVEKMSKLVILFTYVKDVLCLKDEWAKFMPKCGGDCARQMPSVYPLILYQGSRLMAQLHPAWVKEQVLLGKGNTYMAKSSREKRAQSPQVPHHTIERYTRLCALLSPQCAFEFCSLPHHRSLARKHSCHGGTECAYL